MVHYTAASHLGLSKPKWYLELHFGHRPQKTASTPIFQHLLWSHSANGFQTHFQINVKTSHKWHQGDDLSDASYLAQLYILAPPIRVQRLTIDWPICIFVILLIVQYLKNMCSQLGTSK